jgi:lipid A ethanolaminephosphotransferase
VKEFCTKDECRDEILLHGLQEHIDKANGDMLIVLHQLGSHGPTYHKRYPERFKVFVPVCEDTQIQKCDRQSLVNAYDNTILYTDYFLAQVVAFLQKNSENYHTAMLYVSDHGESLGENGIYIHGMPKFMAPKEQLQIPMIAWLSQGYATSRRIDISCVKAAASKPYTHAFIFHTLAGMFDIEATEYSKAHDLFHGCVKQGT